MAKSHSLVCQGMIFLNPATSSAFLVLRCFGRLITCASRAEEDGLPWPIGHRILNLLSFCSHKNDSTYCAPCVARSQGGFILNQAKNYFYCALTRSDFCFLKKFITCHCRSRLGLTPVCTVEVINFLFSTPLTHNTHTIFLCAPCTTKPFRNDSSSTLTMGRRNNS